MAENLQVKFINLHSLDNAEKHYTHFFELIHAENPVSVLRRGQKFKITIHFENRSFTNEDSVRIIFSYGENPNSIKGTKAILSLRNICEVLDDSLFWAVNIIENSEEEDNFYITLEIISPPDCFVGIWNLKIESSDVNSTTEPTIYEYDSDVYLLFNPWCLGDKVYMPDNDKLDEYILSDVGKIWVGPQGFCRGREWIFGQYDACVLPACMLMFRRSGLLEESRGDPVIISRTISKLVNSDDDNGILIARWDGKYSDGIPPAAWTGSVEILKQFLETEAPVAYGQCWVFAGVVTTICRALGIPSRVVSNQISAQDANGSLTIDKFYDEKNEEEDTYNDCIWNYHVWNDVWMARPDLRGEKNLPTYSECNKEINFDGWQAINATPTEKSHGFYQCGPAPLEAIRTGVVGLNFDVGFMLAAVNANLMRWKQDPLCDLEYSKIHCNKFHIGRLILTKKVRCNEQEIITREYKAKDGTDCERKCLLNAIRRLRSRAEITFDTPDAGIKDIDIVLVEKRSIKIGDPFDIVVEIMNKTDRERNFDAILSARSIFYNGMKANEIIKKMSTFKVLPESSETLRVKVNPEDYLEKLVEYGIIKFHAICTEKETNLTWVDEDDFQVQKPSINIDVPEDLEKDKESTVTLIFDNPLKIKLTNCKFYIAGPGIFKNQTVVTEDIEPKAEAIAEVNITPKANGVYNLIATFTSKELVDITGSHVIAV